LVLIAQVVFFLDAGHTRTHTQSQILLTITLYAPTARVGNQTIKYKNKLIYEILQSTSMIK